MGDSRMKRFVPILVSVAILGALVAYVVSQRDMIRVLAGVRPAHIGLLLALRSEEHTSELQSH